METELLIHKHFEAGRSVKKKRNCRWNEEKKEAVTCPL